MWRAILIIGLLLAGCKEPEIQAEVDLPTIAVNTRMLPQLPMEIDCVAKPEECKAVWNEPGPKMILMKYECPESEADKACKENNGEMRCSYLGDD